MPAIPTTRRARHALAAALTASALVLAACGEEAEPEAAGPTAEDLQALEERIGVLESDVDVFERQLTAIDPAAGVVDEPVEPLDDEDAADPVLGEEGAFTGEVVEVVELASDTGAAFWVSDESGQPIPVFTPEEVDPEVALGDVVRVTGTAVETIDPGLFEDELGVAVDEFFADPDAFFAEAEGLAGVVVEEVDVLEQGVAE